MHGSSHPARLSAATVANEAQMMQRAAICGIGVRNSVREQVRFRLSGHSNPAYYEWFARFTSLKLQYCHSHSGDIVRSFLVANQPWKHLRLSGHAYNYPGTDIEQIEDNLRILGTVHEGYMGLMSLNSSEWSWTFDVLLGVNTGTRS